MKSALYLNPNPYCWFIGPKNLSEALIDGELTTCLLDNGAQLNFITTTYAHEWGMDIMSLESLAKEIGGKIPSISGIGGIIVEPEGFIMMNVQIPCVKGYNKDQIAIIMDDPGMKDFPVILGMPMIYRLMEVIKESGISELAIPWASSRVSWLMRGVQAQMSQLAVNDVANKSVAPLFIDEVVRVSHKCKVPPFGHKVIHGSVGLALQGYRMNVMTHGLEKRSPLHPPESLSPVNYSATLYLFLQTLLMCSLGWPLFFILTQKRKKKENDPYFGMGKNTKVMPQKPHYLSFPWKREGILHL